MSLLCSSAARGWRGGKINKEKQEKEAKEETATGFLPGLATHILASSVSHCVTQFAADTEGTSTEKLLQEEISTGHFWELYWMLVVRCLSDQCRGSER